ncbi:PAS domain-containing protein [Jannaschia sp. S6380]|uniref:PAS domain-containing protein n=1 Tax=Jannaschia sp. S6380 TaxID=2926408 RepID=UPI001FF427D9|nr:PAS domain-containing protein [Jannaschia sp. S6380]MCK0168288.1 PAS domain-containing protein [Jannaschia sp. S6380]
MKDGPVDPPRDLPDGLSRATIANFPFSVVLADPREDDCPIVYVNEAFTEMTGYRSDAAIGRNCRFLQGEETDPDARAQIAEAVAAGEAITVDILNYRADGSSFLNRVMLSPLRDEGEELAYFLGLLSDVGDGETTSEQAEDLRLRLRELQHRVKNHLAMILAMIRLEARARPAEEVVRLLTVRVQALSMLYETFSDHEDGAADRVPVGAYLGRVAASFLEIDARPGIRINTQMEEIVLDIEDAGRLGLYMSEVLTNALRHGLRDREAGKIDVEMTVEGNEVLLSVCDDGHGLGDTVWPGETSVGSRIVNDLCQRLDGKLTVESDGNGTVIRLRFPAR